MRENEHDFTRKMLNTIREGQAAKRLLSENDGDDSIQPSPEELNQEQQRFREVVGPRVEFTTFNIYPQAGNVVFGGRFQDMNGMEWQFSLEETDGLYVTANQMQVSDDVVSRIQKLRGYYDNWASEWSTKLATEYKGGK